MPLPHFGPRPAHDLQTPATVPPGAAVRPPQARVAADPVADALRTETLGEMAATLGRLTGELTRALARLARARAALVAAGGKAAAEDEAHWQRRHVEACEALWNVIIQREICGLRRHDAFLDELGVPGSVRLRMGPAALAQAAPDPRRGGAHAEVTSP